MKNYTSKVPAEESVAQIEFLLVRSGARGITKNYDQGNVTSIHFLIESPDTKLPVSIQLPANAEAVFDVLKKSCKSFVSAHKAKQLREQSKRTAWRLMYDWVAVQMSLIELRQAELRQVFLPYIVSSDGTTLYQFLKERKLPALGYANGQEADKDSQAKA